MDKHFRSCRICLEFDHKKKFTSIFKSSDLRIKFEKYFKISLFDDNINDREALICSPCIEQLDKNFEFQQKVRKIDEMYYTPLRNLKLSQNPAELQQSAPLLFPFHNESNEDESENILNDKTEVLGLKIQNVQSLH